MDAFAGIARSTAKHDIFPRDDPRIVDYVLPARAVAVRGVYGKRDPAVNACFIPFADLFFQPRRDVPAVHWHPSFDASSKVPYSAYA